MTTYREAKNLEDLEFYTDVTNEIEVDGRKLRIGLRVDEYSDTSFLGRYTDEHGPWRVDRLEGFLYGAELECPDPEDFPLASAEDPEYPTDDEIDWDLFEQVEQDWDEIPYRVLDETGRDVGRYGHECRYFVPYCGGYPEGPSGELSQEEWQKYALQDYERMEGLNKGDWCYVAVIIEEQCSECGVWSCVESLWGIESDSGEEYFLEVTRDLLSEIGGK